MTAARNRGKSWERRCAELFGGQRLGATGLATPDVETPHLVIEAKRGYEASVRGAWIEQARKASRKYGKPWLVVHARKGSPLSTTTMDTRLALAMLDVIAEARRVIDVDHGVCHPDLLRALARLDEQPQ
ncbi:MAG: hypothetical protein IT175_06050 [Acidobacteria bacterium]|nr:hypothetical protein [Acidobacteriota bacterium]